MKSTQRLYRIEVRKIGQPWKIHNPCMREPDAAAWMEGFNEIGRRLGVEARRLEVELPRIKSGGAA